MSGSDNNNNLQCEFESLKETVKVEMETMEAKNKQALAKSESAIDRLLASNERFRADNVKAIGELHMDYEKLRTDMERGFKFLLLGIVTVGTLAVAIISFVIKL